jgi:hypothetical protein
VALQFDNKISLGHLISLAVVLGTGVIAYADLRTKLTRVVADVVIVEAEATAREARIRAVEIAQAGQTSDLRAIQIGINRIEAQLERMESKP